MLIVQFLTGHYVNPPIFLAMILIKHLPNPHQNNLAISGIIFPFTEKWHGHNKSAVRAGSKWA